MASAFQNTSLSVEVKTFSLLSTEEEGSYYEDVLRHMTLSHAEHIHTPFETELFHAFYAVYDIKSGSIGISSSRFER